MCGEDRGLRGWDLPCPYGGEAAAPEVGLTRGPVSFWRECQRLSGAAQPKTRCVKGLSAGEPGGRGAARRDAVSQRRTRHCLALRADRSTRGAVCVQEPPPPPPPRDQTPVGCCGCPTSSLGLRTAVHPSFSPYHVAFVLFYALFVIFACSHVSLFFFPFSFYWQNQNRCCQ